MIFIRMHKTMYTLINAYKIALLSHWINIYGLKNISGYAGPYIIGCNDMVIIRFVVATLCSRLSLSVFHIACNRIVGFLLYCITARNNFRVYYHPRCWRNLLNRLSDQI